MAEMLEVGTVVDQRLEIISVKQGGFGTVYVCKYRTTGEKAVLKTLQDSVFRNPEAIQRFFREAETWIGLGHHRRIISAYGTVSIGGRPYLHLEYGGRFNLREYVQYFGALPQEDILTIAHQLTEGMTFVQSTKPGLVHADLKPENIIVRYELGVNLSKDEADHFWAEHISEYVSIVDDDERIAFLRTTTGKPLAPYVNVKITDFGLSRVAEPSIYSNELHPRAGTAWYMSPEQCLGYDLDGRSDIYSFGVVLYEMFTGRLPYEAKTKQEYIDCHIRQLPIPIVSLRNDVPQNMAEIVMKCLAKDPNHRHQTFRAIQENLADVVLTEGLRYGIGRWDLINNEPGNIEKELLLAINLVTFGNAEEACRLFEQLSMRTPLDSKHYSSMAEALVRTDHDALALHYAERAILLDSNNTHAQNLRGLALVGCNRGKEALEAFGTVLTRDPENAEILSNLGMTYLDVLHESEKALEFFDRAVKADPKLPEAWLGHGNALAALGRFPQAIASWEKTLQLNSRNDGALVAIGAYLHDNLGQFDQALSLFQEASTINPKNVNAWTNMGVALVSLKRLPEALLAIDSGLAVRPHHLVGLRLKGAILGQLERYEEAITVLREALSVDSEDPRANFNLAVCLARLAKYDEAKMFAEKAVWLAPEHVGAQRLLHAVSRWKP